jgi:hypothetical protein
VTDLAELFQRDPTDISDEEFKTQIIPWMRKQRQEFLIAEAKGDKAPRVKRIQAPKGLSLSDLGLDPGGKT